MRKAEKTGPRSRRSRAVPMQMYGPIGRYAPFFVFLVRKRTIIWKNAVKTAKINAVKTMGKPQSAPSAENNFTSPKPKPSFFSTARQIRSIKKKSRNPHTAPSSGLYQVRINHCPVNKSQYAPARQSKARSAVNWSGIIVYFPSHHAIAANTKKSGRAVWRRAPTHTRRQPPRRLWQGPRQAVPCV